MENVIVQKLESIYFFTLFDYVEEIIEIALENFKGMKNKNNALQWIKCNILAFPRMQYFVARLNEKVVGYILWTEQGGFREEAYFELEQIAVAKALQGNGIGSTLIVESLRMVKEYLATRGSWLRTIKVTTRFQNEKAQRLYQKTLGAHAERCVESPYRAEELEVEMFARFEK